MKNLYLYSVLLCGLFFSSFASATTTPMQDILAAVDYTGIAVWVGVAGVAIIGIAMAFKGVDLGKRGVRKV